MKTHSLVVGFAVIAALLLTPLTAGALIIDQFTDKGLWQAAAGPDLLLEDFDDEAIGSFTDRAFNGFTATNTTPTQIELAIEPANQVSIDGTQFLRYTHAPDSNQSMLWTFDQPFSALGFDWKNTDLTNAGQGNSLLLNVGASTFAFGPPSDEGFFGIIITDGTSLNASITSTTIFGNSTLEDGIFDNIQFNVVPEPSTMLLLGSGLAGLAFFRRRRKGEI